MKCHDCDKELKGGFGIGDEPYIKFRCANCVLEDVKAKCRTNRLEQIVRYTEHPLLPKLEGRKYKEYAVQLKRTLDSIAVWAKE